MFEYFYKRPYTLYSLIAGFFITGVIALTTLPKNLFPDANPPQVIVITVFLVQLPKLRQTPCRNPLSRRFRD